jgi:ElaB/YqjD/DUF883 family membrane-anchored ribosome-binding protein
MSFDQLSSMESQPTTMRREDDPQYTDDPEFQKLSQDLMAKLFNLTGNISRLSNEVAHLGTKRDTERLRERVHDILEETKDTFKDVGEEVKKLQSWDDVSVSFLLIILLLFHTLKLFPAIAKTHSAEGCQRVSKQPHYLSRCPTPSPRETKILCISRSNGIRRATVTRCGR